MSLGIVLYEVIGIVFFGLVDLCRSFLIYGFIIIILKEFWRNIDIVGFFKCEFGDFILIGFDIDVNVLVMVEFVKIEYDFVDFFMVVYIIVGIGVGVGVVVCGKFLYGFFYFEGGYIMVFFFDGDSYFGGCGFNYGYCVEGMVYFKVIVV